MLSRTALRRLLAVPAELAYGDAGRSDEARGQYIPPGAALIFELEMIAVKVRPRGATSPFISATGHRHRPPATATATSPSAATPAC